MTLATLDPAKAASARSYDGLTQDEIDLRVMGFTTVIRAIADKGLATPEDFGRDASNTSCDFDSRQEALRRVRSRHSVHRGSTRRNHRSRRAES